MLSEKGIFLNKKKEESYLGGGQDKIDKQHKSGKLTARERIEVLLDMDSFSEIGMFVEHRSVNFGMQNKHYLGDGVVTGSGTIHGRLVFVFAQDFTVNGGSLGEAHAKKIEKIIDTALKMKAPVIGLYDSGGARIQEGVDSLCGFGRIFQRIVDCSGIIPQISAIMGPCAGGAVYAPALSDFTFMVENTSYMFLTGPDVVKTVTHEELTKEELGGAEVHTEISGVADKSFSNDIDTLFQIRRLIDFLPSNNEERPPLLNTEDNGSRIDVSLNSLVPENPVQAYDMKELIMKIVDEKDFFEIKESYAKNLIVGFARMEGRTVGIIANQPLVASGTLDIDSAKKGARFIRFCDAFNIPLITFTDTSGFTPGKYQEHNGVISSGAKMLYAYAESSVPKINIITRKAYGGAYIVMSSKHLRCDVNFSWINTEIAVMGAESAINIIYKDLQGEEREQKIKEYKDMFSTPFYAASRGYIDEVIKPQNTRKKICDMLRYLQNKKVGLPRKKHDNLPM
ncbi:MAG: acyl-CoA carboxylase subunit beta [Rickettsiales bacterium]|nr:acyl-CoA carboxylase subunit beta [Rickettsiales bacterium]